jgi:hypothetical protein
LNIPVAAEFLIVTVVTEVVGADEMPLTRGVFALTANIFPSFVRM